MTTVRSSWSGSVTFGMVSFPVKLYGAARERDVRFHQVHRACGSRTNAPTVCRECNREVERSELVKGYPISKEQLVLLEDADFEGLPLRSTKSVEVSEFVPLDEVPYVMFNRTYYVGPDDRTKVGHKAFALFRDSLAAAGKAGVGTITLRTGRESLCVIRPEGKALALTLLYWADEITNVAEVEESIEEVEASPEETEMARQLIEALVKPVSALNDHQDTYREALEILIDAKLTGRVPSVQPVEQVKAGDLMAALKASVDAAKEAA